MENSTSPAVGSSESEKAKPRLTMTQSDEHQVVEDEAAKGRPALDRIDLVCDGHNRAKLYELNDQNVWDDKGTGHVACVQSRDQPDAGWIVVRHESNEKNVLESRILPDTIYQKQQGTMIGWSEPDGSNLVLSFQENAGCAEIWNKISQIQGKGPDFEIMDNRNNYSALSEKLRASEARNVQLMTEIQEISAKYQTLTEELKVAQEQILQLEAAKIQEKQTPVAQLMAVLEETTQKVKEMANQEDLLKSAVQMKAEIKNKEMEAGKVAGENETLKRENATLKDQNKSSMAKIRQMEQKMAELEAKIHGFDAKKKQADKNETLVKELQAELEKSRKEAEEAVNTHSQVYRTLTGLLPQLTPSKPEKRRFSVPARNFTIPAPPVAVPAPPVAISSQGKDNNDNVGKKFYQCKDKEKMVCRDGFAYGYPTNLKSQPLWKVRMQCSRVGGKNLPCKGSIWATGEWETDTLGRRYQRGILRGNHSHVGKEKYFTQDETVHIGGHVVNFGNPMDDKQSSDEGEVEVIREIVNNAKRQSQGSGSDGGPAKRGRPPKSTIPAKSATPGRRGRPPKYARIEVGSQKKFQEDGA
ncbi:serine/threonine-protein phosphatase 4 regulatory subunit 3 [Ditylenchus destructor]|uniref:Serine/threonine-protein phosphatase 4 regulatory subunit 3 n=1 Tax=Ditylenchus destructor TaxID=166010 RepID=A0AAD4MKW5_9BILA|nr:serine/threonine-protein phosphatase 4 regulatory subunit 3 [Ditylenchus destructor]